MIRIGICDDSAEARFGLRLQLERLAERRGMEAVLYEFSSGEGVLKWSRSRAGETDLLFLDIEMEGMDGMETARKIRAENTAILLVFVTGYGDYVFDGYSVGALDYLMKPVKEERLDEVLVRALGTLNIQEEEVYTCRNGEGLYRIPRNTIQYFSSEKRQVTCHTSQRNYTFYGKLDDAERQAGVGFIRIHQRYLVRAGAVSRMGAEAAALSSGEVLPVSRAYRKEAALMMARILLQTERTL